MIEGHNPWQVAPLLELRVFTFLDVVRLYADRLLFVSRILHGLTMLANDPRAANQNLGEGFNFGKDELEKFHKVCTGLGLPMSAMQTKRLLEGFERKVSFDDISVLAHELNTRIMDELKGLACFAFKEGRVQYYDDPQPFGEEVADCFLSASFDIEESAKCLAVSRNTACVFHLMRVMEVGLRNIGTSLNDPTLIAQANPTWERILKRCDSELQKNYNDRTPEWCQDNKFFSDATANLRAVKAAWRNPTMHIESVYDGEKALEIYNAVRAFMRHLATKLSEART